MIPEEVDFPEAARRAFMTTEQKAFEEALRRIREAEDTGALTLYLNGLALKELPRELARLASRRSLDLSGCEQLSGDLSTLAGLTSLRLFYLYNSEHLSGDLSPLAGLTSLRLLYLSGCRHLSGDLSMLARLTSLQSLDLSGCEQLSGYLSVCTYKPHHIYHLGC